MLKNKIIVICGIHRSGTTILGKLIGSLEHMEFFNEPKTIDVLFSLIDKIDEKHWKAMENKQWVCKTRGEHWKTYGNR